MGKQVYGIEHEVNIVKLEAMRKKLNLSQEVFAEYIGVGHSSYKNILKSEKCGQVLKQKMIDCGVVPIDVFN